MGLSVSTLFFRSPSSSFCSSRVFPQILYVLTVPHYVTLEPAESGLGEKYSQLGTIQMAADQWEKPKKAQICFCFGSEDCGSVTGQRGGRVRGWNKAETPALTWQRKTFLKISLFFVSCSVTATTPTLSTCLINSHVCVCVVRWLSTPSDEAVSRCFRHPATMGAWTFPHSTPVWSTQPDSLFLRFLRGRGPGIPEWNIQSVQQDMYDLLLLMQTAWLIQTMWKPRRPHSRQHAPLMLVLIMSSTGKPGFQLPHLLTSTFAVMATAWQHPHVVFAFRFQYLHRQWCTVW